MSKSTRPPSLTCAVTQFITHKRMLGHRYRHEAWLLQSLRQHVKQCGSRDLTAKYFEQWLTSLKDHHPNTRRKWYQIVRQFCLYRRRSEPGCFLPPDEGTTKGQPYVTPVIVEPAQIARMLGIASELPRTNRSPLRAPALRLAIVLLYTCGLRLGELLRLTLGDVEERGTVLRIRESKFHKSRLVPLSLSATLELQIYLRKRRRAFAVYPNMPLLCNRYGGHPHPYSHSGLEVAINSLFNAASVRDERGRRPRVHDLRHSFAVQALIRWYRKEADVQSSLPKLALYMGHVSIKSSAHYLHWVPTLQRLASQRFERRFGRLIEEGAR
jgi:integrase/recombinase XerD